MTHALDKLTEDKILSFMHFDDGWFFGVGRKIPDSTITTALIMNRYLRQAHLITDAFPVADYNSGGILLNVYLHRWTVEIEILDNAISFEIAQEQL